MVNPGSFQGSRKEFLTGEKPAYAAGVVGGYAADALAVIQRRFFKRYPVELPHEDEPTADFTSSVDDDVPDDEQAEPDEAELGVEEYLSELDRLEARRDKILFRKAIKRWLAYQYMKDHDMDPKESGAHNPHRVLLHKLTGVSLQRPRQKSAANVWRKTQSFAVAEKVKERVIKECPSRSQLAALRDKVAREMFGELSKQEQDQWADQAKEEHHEALEMWKHDTEGKPSDLPADRQRCIEGLVRFVQPILDLICEATGWNATLIAGGPEPAHEGRLNVISVHSGTTSGNVKMNFGRTERARYKKYFVPIYGSFLQKCYTPDECRLRALPAEEGFEGLFSMNLEKDGADFDTLDLSSTAPASETPTSTGVDVSAPPDPPTNPTSLDSITPVTTTTTSSSRTRTPSPPLSPAVSPAPSPSRSPGPAISPGPSHIEPVSTPPDVVGGGTDSTVPKPRGRKRKAVGQSAGMAIEDADEPSTSLPVSRKQQTRGSASFASLPVTQPPAKRPRTRGKTSTIPPSTTSSSASTARGPAPNTPSSATSQTAPTSPKWFITALTMLEGDHIRLGSRWAKLVSLWSRFEAQENFKAVGNLKSTNRPAVVSDWIQRARAPAWRPTIKDVVSFEADFIRWWTLLQPEWRISANGKILTTELQGDWEALRKPGVNGLLSVMAALFFWGLQVDIVSRERRQWNYIIEDLLNVVEQLIH